MSLPMTVMNTFFDGVREMRAATIPILFEDVVPIPPIGVISPNCFCHSNGTHKEINRVREHIQADAMVEITMRIVFGLHASTRSSSTRRALFPELAMHPCTRSSSAPPASTYGFLGSLLPVQNSPGQIYVQYRCRPLYTSMGSTS